MNTHVNPDKGVLRVAPDVTCKEITVGANVTALSSTGGRVVAGLGDGRVVSVEDGATSQVAQHDGAVTGLCLDGAGQVFSTGQDGCVLKNGSEVLPRKDQWITCVCQSPDRGRFAIATGASVIVLQDGQTIARLDDFPSTVTDVSFFKGGSRLAISHYGGVTLWDIERLAKPEKLVWAGSMISVSVSPDDRYIAGATQDREVHVWDLATGRDFRLGGYQRKVKKLGWTTDLPYLYTTGADALVAWGLAGDPGAFPPKEIGYAFSQTVSAVTENGLSTALAAGFSDGSIIIGEAHKGTAKIVRAAGGPPVNMLVDVGEGAFAFGTQGGEVGLFRLVDGA